jgi:hypothetical protein
MGRRTRGHHIVDNHDAREFLALELGFHVESDALAALSGQRFLFAFPDDFQRIHQWPTGPFGE